MSEFVLNTEGAETVWSALPEFLQGYIEAAFFVSAGSADDGELEGVKFGDLAPVALESMAADCRRFEQENHEALEALDGAEWDGAVKFGPYDRKAAGRDFWYTRNGHGVGFWDRGFTGEREAAAAERLTAAAEAYGESTLYMGDDSRVYVSP